MLADDGATILKFFLHISKKEQKERFQAIEKDPLEAWRVTPADWARNKKYDEYLVAIEDMLELTESEYAPWTIVEATSKWHARQKVFETIIAAMEARLGPNAPPRTEAIADQRCRLASGHGVAQKECWLMLETVDLTLKMDREAYVQEVTRRQIQLRELGYQVYLQKRPVVIAFEGWDAAGRAAPSSGSRRNSIRAAMSCIRSARRKARIRRAIICIVSGGGCRSADRSPSSTGPGMDACWWSAWKGSPKRLSGSADLRRSIPFERQLRDYGVILAKFWVHISREEQLRRFEERKAIGYKEWKLTDEDWRNREKWGAYEEAVEEMLVKTSTRSRHGAWWKATTSIGPARRCWRSL